MFDKQNDCPELFVSCDWRPPLEDSFLHTVIKVGRIPKKVLQLFVVPHIKNIVYQKYCSKYAEYIDSANNDSLSEEQLIQFELLECDYQKFVVSINDDEFHKKSGTFPDAKIDGIFNIEFLLHSELTLKQKNTYAAGNARKKCDSFYIDIIEDEIRKRIKFGIEFLRTYFGEFCPDKINKIIPVNNNDIQHLEQKKKVVLIRDLQNSIQVDSPSIPVSAPPAPADSKRGKTTIDYNLMGRIGKYIQNNITEKDKLSYRAIAREFNLGSGTISSNETLKKFIDDMINSGSHSIDNNPNFDNDPYSNWEKN